ncbi:MAG: hypothetical protein EOP10_22765 [Proteobacteria bacterium]|nr:MAG: hypothetical protein EOP10_22765 [Pseudomonadota bacterium]
MTKILPLFLLLSLGLSMARCVTPEPADYGVQANHLAHIPARIAVFPCRKWPQGALYAGQRVMQTSEAELTTLCSSFDAYVLQGFEGQPYMRGLSPAVVKKLLARSPKEAQLEQLEDLWFRPSQVCEACRNPTSYYKEVVASRSDWRKWLSDISRETTSSDAVLIPFISEADGEVINDRGLFYASRHAELVLLLIDTNNGELIWANGKRADLRLPLEKKPDDPKAVALPVWEDLWKRVLVPEIWAEFPGRQG